MFPSIVLLLWLFVAIAMFSFYRPTKAIAYVVCIGMLFLPEIATLPIPLPVLKVMGKSYVTTTAGFLGCFLFARRRFRALRLGRGIDLLVWASILFPIITALLNQDTLVFGPRVVTALSINEVLLYPVYTLMGLAFPFWLGRMVVTSTAEAKQLIRVVVIMGLIYSVLELFEMRMSPNLHVWVYGIAPFENFTMAIRWGGYRPTVFLVHGLATAIFTLVATLLTATQSFYQKRMGRFPAWAVTLYMFVILIFCRSTGAILFGVVMVPIILFLKPRRWFAITSLLALLFCVYPTLRILNSFPDDSLDSYYATASPEVQDRIRSLTFRFQNERILTARASERFWFGWGGSGRGRVYNQDGDDISITDGAWIICLSENGVLGFLANYGLLILPLFYASRRAKKLRQKENVVILGGFCFVVVSYLLDQIPNGAFTFTPHFFAGVVWQYARLAVDEERMSEASPAPAPPPSPILAPRGPRKVIVVK